ncbi:MAG: twin-arginine translocase TatA/TatE family subunit [Acidimicrobiia bacterium]|nr:twin-arginine translocase TatA/TatE family subunit [Acidimicrobiia bacterium]
MFNVGGGEIFVILLLALLLLGPDKLPEAARRIGSVVARIRRMTSGFEEEIRSAMDLRSVMDPRSPAPEPDVLGSTSAGPTLSGPPAAVPTPRGAFVVDLGRPGGAEPTD